MVTPRQTRQLRVEDLLASVQLGQIDDTELTIPLYSAEELAESDRAGDNTTQAEAAPRPKRRAREVA